MLTRQFCIVTAQMVGMSPQLFMPNTTNNIDAHPLPQTKTPVVTPGRALYTTFVSIAIASGITVPVGAVPAEIPLLMFGVFIRLGLPSKSTRNLNNELK